MLQILRHSLITTATLWAFVLFYVARSTEGSVWASEALIWTWYGTLSLFSCAIGATVLAPSRPRAVFVGLLALLWLLTTFLGGLGCGLGGLSGGYTRSRNCGAENTLWFGFAMFFFVLLTLAQSILMPAAIILSIPLAGFPAVGMYLAQPLRSHVLAQDASTTCYLRQPNYYSDPFDHAAATRVLFPNDLKLGLIIGERSPRIFKTDATGTYTWRFSTRSFEVTNRKEPAQICAGLIAVDLSPK